MAIDVIAPMPGTIKEIIVKSGDAVKEDKELIILEAMKMENPIVAPLGGEAAHRRRVAKAAGERPPAPRILYTLGAGAEARGLKEIAADCYRRSLESAMRSESRRRP